MLVHLKPRRKSKQHEVMQNYVQTTNWHYGTSNAIHCKKNIVTSNLQRILTNRVSANGQSLSPSHLNPESIELNKSEDPKTLRLKHREQKQEETKKKEVKQKKSMRIELATVYKKTFKYNTTMHQILKNVCKKSQCRHRKEACEDEKHASHHCELNFQKFSQLGSPLHRHSKREECDDNFLNKSGEKLKMLENLKKKCTSLEVEQKNNDISGTNALKFSDNQKCRSMIKTTLFDWKTLKPHHNKLHWRKESYLRNTLKESVCLGPKSFSNARTNEICLDTGLITSEDNPIDYLFYTCDEGKELSPSKPNTERTEFVPHSHKQIKKIETRKQPHKKSIYIESEPNYSFLRNKKFSLNRTDHHPTQFSVEAWNTKDKDRQWDELQHFAT